MKVQLHYRLKAQFEITTKVCLYFNHSEFHLAFDQFCCAFIVPLTNFNFAALELEQRILRNFLRLALTTYRQQATVPVNAKRKNFLKMRCSSEGLPRTTGDLVNSALGRLV